MRDAASVTSDNCLLHCTATHCPVQCSNMHLVHEWHCTLNCNNGILLWCLLADAKPVKKGRKRKLAALDGPKKPTVISTNSPKKTSSPAKKKGKKRNPWSDSEGSEADNSDQSDMDMDASFDNVVEREKAPRRAAG